MGTLSGTQHPPKVTPLSWLPKLCCCSELPGELVREAQELGFSLAPCLVVCDPATQGMRMQWESSELVWFPMGLTSSWPHHDVLD